MKMDPAHICYYEDEYSLDLLKQFQQGFPHIDQYPSDANQGLDIPPAGVPSVVFIANMSFDNNFFKQVPVLFKLQALKVTVAFSPGIFSSRVVTALY
ncbi:hypothetical protein ACS0TY_017179 [Phlomoides rotata]